MTRATGGHIDCDHPGCGRFLFRYHNDTEHTMTVRAAERGWLLFEHHHLCNIHRHRVDRQLAEMRE